MKSFAEASHVLDKQDVPYSFYKPTIFSLIYMTISDGCQFVLVPNKLVLSFIASSSLSPDLLCHIFNDV